MATTFTDKDWTWRAVTAVASQYRYKPDPIAYARELLASKPQTWAYQMVQDELRSDGYKVTQARKDAIWRALGGK